MTLNGEWLALCRSYNVSPAIAEKWFQVLQIAYSSDGRFYHTLDHIADVLQSVNEISGSADLHVLWAVWFHDIVYDTWQNDNEERSANLAEKAMLEMGLPMAVREDTRRLIEMTKTHRPNMDDMPACILCDADLAILGAVPDRYRKYANDIRREYAWVTDDAYRIGRIKVLQDFLERPRIYFTATRHSREQQARHNISEEISRLHTLQ